MNSYVEVLVTKREAYLTYIFFCCVKQVLILLPFASIMYDVVMSLIKLTPSAEVRQCSIILFISNVVR